MSEEESYEAFVQHLAERGWVPITEDFRASVRERYSPEQAAFLACLPTTLTGLEEIAAARQADPSELASELDALAREGVVYRRVDGDTVLYSLNGAFFTFLRSSFWEGREDEQMQALAPPVNRYYANGFFECWKYSHVQGLRTLPIEETIADTRQVLPYEDVVQLAETLDYPSVSYCPCKQRHNLDPDTADCEHPVEVCLHFGDLSRYIVDNGMGRETTRDELREILRKAATSGLVHGISNQMEGVDTICNCCQCCCMWLEQYHVLGHPMSLSPSNYLVAHANRECKACGLCVSRCPMDATHLEEWPGANNRFGKVSVTDLEHCIGCGVCVYTCPVEALSLVRRPTIEDPPRDGAEFGRLMAEDIRAALAGSPRE